MYNFELFQREFFNPLKRNVQFFHPPKAGLQKVLTLLTCRPPPYCWVKNDQPFTRSEKFNIKSNKIKEYLFCAVQSDARDDGKQRIFYMT